MGEREGDRAAMERVTERMIKSGVKPSTAAEKARESMIRSDRKLREQGKR